MRYFLHNLVLITVCLILQLLSLSVYAQSTYKGTPFGGNARSIPGTIEAEDFDEGGEGVAYHDSDPVNNAPGGLRTKEGVDLWASGIIGWFKDGEWLKYTVDVESGIYDITVWGGSNTTEDHGLVIYLGDSLLTLVDVPYSGSWDPIANTVNRVVIPKGGKGRVLRLQNINNDFDFDKTVFVKTGGVTSSKAIDKPNVGFYPTIVGSQLTITNLDVHSLVSVYNIAGTKLSETENGIARELKIGMASLRSGVYFVKVNSGNSSKQQSFKIIKK